MTLCSILCSFVIYCNKEKLNCFLNFPLCIQPEPVPKSAEVPEEKPPETKAESPKKSVDTTNLHKSHLFDLNCKICTGKKKF